MGDAAAKARDEGIKETNRQFELAKEEQGTAEERYKVARKDKVVATVPKSSIKEKDTNLQMDQAEAGLAESKVKVGELRLKVEKSERDEKGRIEEAANLARRVHPERVLNGVLLMNGPDVYIARAPIPTVLLIKTMCRMRVCEVCMCETQPSCVVRLYVREHAWDISPFCCFVETRRPGLSCRLQFHHVRLPQLVPE